MQFGKWVVYFITGCWIIMLMDFITRQMKNED